MSISQEKKNQIKQALEDKNALKVCERCGNPGFEILDQYFVVPSQTSLDGVQIGTGLPTAGLVCKNCGNLVFHAIGAILPEEMIR
ncbi:hypothetical protein C4578_04145 [Candidatus Microgenomates bacterium]|nr:MAG: hypothetical protein C4578_04145 [Candidatus Microgenomates bacterium]